MLWTIVVALVGWWTGRNWDMVKQMYNDKVKPKLSNAGKATKID